MTVTTCGKNIVCPYWEEKITLTGYYKVQNSNELNFYRSTCPIIENSKLPISKQEKRYELMRCPYDRGCHFLDEFKPVVNLETDGYSQ